MIKDFDSNDKKYTFYSWRSVVSNVILSICFGVILWGLGVMIYFLLQALNIMF